MNYLYSYPAMLAFDKADNRQPGDLAFDQKHGDRFVYLSGTELFFSDGVLIGAWNDDGTVVDGVAVDPVYMDIRPIGNLDSTATQELRHHYFLGHNQRYLQATPLANTLPFYPADNQPIVLSMERYWDDTAGFEGWGWKATIDFSDPGREPDARAIGIYDESWSYLYTTGAFVYTNLGNDGWKWQTKNPPGRATTDKESLNYALLFGAAQEGKMLLPVTQDFMQNYFWEADQVIPGGEEWVDSGETVTGMAGTVALVSDVAPFPVGTQVRIEGAEAVVTSIWAGQGLVLDPYAARTTGAAIEVWQ